MALPLSRTRTRTGASSVSAAMASVVTVTQSVQPSSSSNQYDSSSTRLDRLSTIMPGFLIAFFGFAAVFMACGLITARRRRRRRQLDHSSAAAISPASEGSERPKKKKQKPMKPVLWEVDVNNLCAEKDLEALHPVAVELQADPWQPLKAGNAGRESEKRSHWLAPMLSRSNKSEDARTSMQQAQVTFMVSMPAPEHLRQQPSRELAIGTTLVPYQPEDDESDDEDASSKIVDRHGFTYAY